MKKNSMKNMLWKSKKNSKEPKKIIAIGRRNENDTAPAGVMFR